MNIQNPPHLQRTQSGLRFGNKPLFDKDDPSMAALKKNYETQSKPQPNRRDLNTGKKPGVLGTLIRHPVAILFAIGGLVGGTAAWNLKNSAQDKQEQWVSQADERSARYNLGGSLQGILQGNRVLEGNIQDNVPLDRQSMEKVTGQFNGVVSSLGTVLSDSREQADMELSKRAGGRYEFGSGRYNNRNDEAYRASSALQEFLQVKSVFRGTRQDLETALDKVDLLKSMTPQQRKDMAEALYKDLTKDPTRLHSTMESFLNVTARPAFVDQFVQYVGQRKALNEPLDISTFLKNTAEFSNLKPAERERLAHQFYDFATKEQDAIARAMNGYLASEVTARLETPMGGLVENKGVKDIRAFLDTHKAFEKFTASEKDAMAKSVHEIRGSNRYEWNNTLEPFFAKFTYGVSYEEIMKIKTMEDLKPLVNRVIDQSEAFSGLSKEDKAMLKTRASYWLDTAKEGKGEYYSSSSYRYGEDNNDMLGFAWFLLVISTLGSLAGAGTLVGNLVIRAYDRNQEKKALRENGIFKIMADGKDNPEVTRIQGKLTAHCTKIAEKRNKLSSSQNPEVKAFFGQAYSVVAQSSELKTAFENQVQDEVMAEGKMSVSAEEFWTRLEKRLDQAIKTRDYFPEIPPDQIVVMQDELTTLPENQQDFAKRLQHDIDSTNQSMGRSALTYMNQLLQLQEDEEQLNKLMAEETALRKSETEDPTNLMPSRQVQLKNHEVVLAHGRVDTVRQALEKSRTLYQQLEAKRFQYQKHMLDTANRDSYNAVLERIKTLNQAQETLNKVTGQSPLMQELDALNAQQAASAASGAAPSLKKSNTTP